MDHAATTRPRNPASRLSVSSELPLSVAAKTALGSFWKSGWAFVLGYWVSTMIQAFVPKSRLTRYMGDPDFGSVSLATVFGAISSSWSGGASMTSGRWSGRRS